ncbi:MAG: replication-relaxation family protein [Thermoanaerobaculia bacterium]
MDRCTPFSFPWADADSVIPERDRSMLAALVLLRLLSYDQLHRLLFAERDRSALRHRLAALAKGGWVARWDRARTATRAERYALPTAQTLDAAIAAIRLRADGTTFGALVAQMLPKVRRPLVLAAARDPKWLQHQREVNDLVISIAAVRPLSWVSTWDAPFVSKAGIVDLPQPDYVLIEDAGGGAAELVFGEHDRGNEPIERFIARKILPYTDLLRFPEVLREFCAVDAFRVDVSVLDAPRQRPIRRLTELLEAAAASVHPELFRFTLAGWLAANPKDPTWFTPANPPQSESVAWEDHAAH